MTTLFASALEAGGAPPRRNLVRHQVGKDLLRHRTVLLAWWALLGVVSWLAPSPFDINLGTPELTSTLLDILVIALIGRLMFEDPIVGTTRAFWLTLPLPRRTLFLTKLVLLAVGVWLPTLLAQGACLLGLGLPLAQCVPSLLQAALWQAALILGFALLATMVYGYARLFGAALLVSAGLLLAVFGIRAIAEKVAPGWLERGCDRLVPLLLIGLAVLVGLAALAVRYLDPRQTRSLGHRLLPGAPLLLVWIGALGALTMSYQPPRRHPPAESELHSVFDQEITLSPGSESEVRARYPRTGQRQLAGTISLANPGGTYRLVPAGIRSRLALADGSEWSSEFRRWPRSFDTGYGIHDVALGLIQPEPGTNPSTFTRPILKIPPDIQDPNDSARTGTLTADLELDGFRCDLATSMPLRSGSTARVGDYGVRLSGASFSPVSGLQIVVRTTRALIDRDKPESAPGLGFALQLGPGGDVVRLSWGMERPQDRLVTAFPAHVLNRYVLELDSDTATSLGLTGADREAWSRASILVSREAYVGSVVRALRVEEFRPAQW